MRGKTTLALAAFALSVSGYGAGQRAPLLPEVQQHLNLARRCAHTGETVEAAAHASVVTPERSLKVRVDVGEVPANQQGLFRNALSGAFSMWEDALHQRVFEVTETGAADVVIHFRRNVSDRGVEVCGHSEWTRGVLTPSTDPKVVLTADVQVRMFKPGGQPLSFDQLRACTAHELGHVLGLDDSPIAGDLMARMDFNHPATSIRPEEVETLLQAREEAEQIRRNVSYRAVKYRRQP